MNEVALAVLGTGIFFWTWAVLTFAKRNAKPLPISPPTSQRSDLKDLRDQLNKLEMDIRKRLASLDERGPMILDETKNAMLKIINEVEILKVRMMSVDKRFRGLPKTVAVTIEGAVELKPKPRAARPKKVNLLKRSGIKK